LGVFSKIGGKAALRPVSRFGKNIGDLIKRDRLNCPGVVLLGLDAPVEELKAVLMPCSRQRYFAKLLPSDALFLRATKGLA